LVNPTWSMALKPSVIVCKCYLQAFAV